MLKKIFCCLICLIVCLLGFSQSSIDSNFHLYLLAGQSNMAGRGEVIGEFQTAGDSGVYMLNKNNEWVLAKHPLHFDKPIAGVGPGLAFAIKMRQADPGVKIGLVPCAVGGSSINAWQPGAYDSSTKTHPYDDAMKRISIAMKTGVFKGVLWHQGESDSDPKSAGNYLPKLEALIKAIRDSIHHSNLPFVVGQLGRYKDVYNNINNVITDLPKRVPFTAIVSSKGLKQKGDMTHFDSPSADKFGKRFAREMMLLQQKLKSRDVHSY